MLEPQRQIRQIRRRNIAAPLAFVIALEWPLRVIHSPPAFFAWKQDVDTCPRNRISRFILDDSSNARRPLHRDLDGGRNHAAAPIPAAGDIPLLLDRDLQKL